MTANEEKGRGNRRVVRYRSKSYQIVLDPALLASAGIEDGDILEEIVQGPGTILLRKTGDRKERPEASDE